MPSLLLAASYNTDSRVLRRAAYERGWATLRLSDDTVPEDFKSPDGRFALYFSTPVGFIIADQLNLMLLGCDAGWLPGLPQEFLKRRIRPMTLAEAGRQRGKAFVKLATGKGFPAAVYTRRALAERTGTTHPDTQVLVAEAVHWEVEYRCFMLHKQVVTLSAYLRHGRLIRSSTAEPGAFPGESQAALEFARKVLTHPAVEAPPALVLDVGIIQDRGWAVIEPNEPWGAGVYACKPDAVLDTILRACVGEGQASMADRRWNYREHYRRARAG